MKVDVQDTCVDEFTGATSKGQESSAVTIAKITKVSIQKIGHVDCRLGRERGNWSTTSTMQMWLDRN